MLSEKVWRVSHKERETRNSSPKKDIEQMKPIYKWIAAGAGLLLAGFMIWYFSTIVFYILAAVVVAILGRPFVRLLSSVNIRGHRLPPWLKAAVTLCILILLFFGLLAWITPILTDKLSFFTHYDISQFDQMLADPIREFEAMLNNLIPFMEFSVREVIFTQLEPFLASGEVSNILQSATNFAISFVMAVFSISFISFFFLKDDGLFVNSVATLFPKHHEQSIRRAMYSITNLLIRYFVGIFVESAIKFIVVTLAVNWIVGLGWGTAVLIGLVTAVLNVIPYIGPIIGGLISFGIAAISPIEGVTLTTAVLEIGAILLVFQLIDNILLQPYIYASSVKAHPLEIFIIILMAGYMAGIIGMLFAIPTYTVIRVIAKEFLNNFRVVQKLTEKI